MAAAGSSSASPETAAVQFPRGRGMRKGCNYWLPLLVKINILLPNSRINIASIPLPVPIP